MNNMEVRQKVITVESHDDPSSLNMLQALYQNEKFGEYEVYHCFIGKVYNGDDLYKTLSGAILQYKANIILIHTGKAFTRLREYFPEVLRLLISTFANLKIGIQYRQNQKNSVLQFASNDESILNIEKKFFEIRR